MGSSPSLTYRDLIPVFFCSSLWAWAASCQSKTNHAQREQKKQEQTLGELKASPGLRPEEIKKLGLRLPALVSAGTSRTWLPTLRLRSATIDCQGGSGDHERRNVAARTSLTLTLFANVLFFLCFSLVRARERRAADG